MKSMFTFISIIILFGSCEKEKTTPNYLPGKWELIQTELYVNEVLSGTATYDEASTVYEFDACTGTEQSNCTLYLSEDGNTAIHTYTYDPGTNVLILDETNTYSVDATQSELTLSQEYGENKSIWSFRKER